MSGTSERRISCDGLLWHASEVHTFAGGEGPLGGLVEDTGRIMDGAVAWKAGRITWCGPSRQALEHVVLPEGVEPVECAGHALLPGLVDSHTHLLFAGTREEEWELRLRGVSYEEIAARGGGILSTVAATRSASPQELRQLAESRLERSLRHGVTTVEVKTGYGLSWESELKSLEVLRDIRAAGRFEVVPTFLGAHEVGPEFRGRTGEYVQEMIREWIPAVARLGLADFFDVFCERGVFELEHTRALCETALAAGLQIKLHADELHALGGAGLAAELGAVTADHLIRARTRDLERMRAAGTLPVLLPGTSLLLGAPFAPWGAMRDLGLPAVLATDCNPGTCYCENLSLMGSLALGGYRMPPSTALAAVTRNAAYAVGQGHRLGRLEPGFQMDALLLAEPTGASLFYHMGADHVQAVWKRGELRFKRTGTELVS